MSDSFFKVGKKYFIRCATYHCTGEVVEVNPMEIILTKAAWIADSGRLYTALMEGSFVEQEPFVTNIMVNRYGIIDATEWTHDLPDVQK